MKTVQAVRRPLSAAPEVRGQLASERRVFPFLASVLFFLSGCTGLIYEVVWFKRFTHVWGGSSLAMTVVVASFLGGLGLGAFLLGKRADRSERPLAWYGWCEIAIGVIALLVPLEIALLFRVSAVLHPVLMDSPLALAFVRLVLTFLTIGPACVLMGGTLPFVVKHLSTRMSGGAATAWLYAINTFGAAVGCFVAGFFLLPSLGLSTTNLLAVAINLALGFAAIALAKRTPAASSPAEPEHAALLTSRWNAKLLLGGAAVTGFAALALQIVWTRQLALVLGGTTYAFTAVLFVVLVGIAVGSLLFRFWLSEVRDQGAVLGGTLLVLVAGAVLGKLLVPQAIAGTASLKHLRDSQSWNALICLASSSTLQLLPSIAMGILFPWFVNAARFASRELGAGVGRVYACNTIGSICGAVAGTFLLLPSLGTALAIGVCLALYFLTWIALFPSETPRWKFISAITAFLLLVMASVASEREDPRITNIGQFMYGYREPEEARAGNRVLFHADGASCSVLVRELNGGFRALCVNGKTDASDGGDDMPMQLGLAYLPMALHPQAKELLVIGFGSGCTSGASLLFAGTRVTCCEIEPAVLDAAPNFAHVNHRPYDSPDLHVVFNDGRNHLQGTDARYDLILSEPSNPWIAGVSNLFTRQFYEAASARLADGGILAQWVQTYSIGIDDYAAIAATITSVFPECALLRISKGDTILLASKRPLIPDAAVLALAQARVDQTPAITADLERYFGTRDVRSLLLKTLLLDTAGVRRFVAAGVEVELITDLNLRLEFDAPRALFVQESKAPEITQRLLSAVSHEWFGSLLRKWACGSEQIAALEALESTALELGQKDFVQMLAQSVLDFDATATHFSVSHLVTRDASEIAAALPAVVAGSELDASRLGVSLCAAQRYDEAITVFRALASKYPRSATVLGNLAVNLKAREVEGWREALDRAHELDPYNDFVRSLRSQYALDVEPTHARD